MKVILCELATHKDRKAFSVQHHQLVRPLLEINAGAGDNLAEMPRRKAALVST